MGISAEADFEAPVFLSESRCAIALPLLILVEHNRNFGAMISKLGRVSLQLKVTSKMLNCTVTYFAFLAVLGALCIYMCMQSKFNLFQLIRIFAIT